MSPGNGDIVNVNTQRTEAPFKDVHAKRMNSGKIIGIDKNLIKIISVIF